MAAAAAPVEAEPLEPLEVAELAAVFKLSQSQLRAHLQFVSKVEDVAQVLHRIDPEKIPREGTEQLSRLLTNALEIANIDSQEVGQLFFSGIFRWALAALGEDEEGVSFKKNIEVWKRCSGEKRVTYTAAQCKGLLANALLLNVQDTSRTQKTGNHLGGLDFSRIYFSSSPVAAQRVACLLHYFHVQYQEERRGEKGLRLVTWERRCSDETLEAFKDWIRVQGQTKSCDPVTCDFKLHTEAMEAIDGDGFVNFANPTFGYGRFIASCTQEEIIASCCPEFNVGMLHQGEMTEEQVIVVSGAARFSAYSGYQKSFKFEGPSERAQQQPQSILCMDAATREHFTERMSLRDIRKAFLAFEGCRLVSTGRWGCGVFKGLPVHKLIQQVIAASLAGCSLRFSTFGGTSDLCDVAMELLEREKPATTTLLDALHETCRALGTTGDDGFEFLRTLAFFIQQEKKKAMESFTLGDGI